MRGIATTAIGAIISIVIVTAASAGPAEDMMAADKAFSDMSVAKGRHAAFLAYMADDVRQFTGATPPVVGKAAMAKLYGDSEAKNSGPPKDKLEWAPIEAKASDDGSLGWTRGHWTYTATDDSGKPVKNTGYYVTLWRRQADGAYKYEVDLGGEDSEIAPNATSPTMPRMMALRSKSFGLKIAAMPAAFSLASSSGGMMPPATTFTSPSPASFSFAIISQASGTWLPERMESPMTCGAPAFAAAAISSAVKRMPS